MAIDGILTTGISGLQTASTRVATVATNIVNANTEGFTASRVSQTTLVSDPAANSGTAVQAQVLGTDQPPNLAADIVDLIAAEQAYTASAEIVRTAEELSDETLDILS